MSDARSDEPVLPQTGTSSVTLWFDANGNEEFPCHCGEIHRGDYALYDFLHHNCRHPEILAPDDLVPDQLLCASCGQVFAMIQSNGGCSGGNT